MFDNVTPASLLHGQVAILQKTLPAVFDGQAEGIHDARIATRRIRELLPLLTDERRSRGADDLRNRFRQIGRSLGRVRDMDVRMALLARLEQRIPHAAPTLVLVRQQRERDRLELMRKLIKRLERLDAVRLVDVLLNLRVAHRGAAWPLRATLWRRMLQSVLAARSQAAVDAIEHATGVYFPNRVHAARIAIKRLRYATEVVHETGSADRAGSIRELKKAQDILGDLHDCQDLTDHLEDEASRASSEPAEHGTQVALVRQVIDADARELHAKYLTRREPLVAVCRELADAAALPWRPSPSLLAVGAAAVICGGAGLSMHRTAR